VDTGVLGVEPIRLHSHEGYWGPHVGWYGGINYGFGYFGHGYNGGRWDGRHFFYNRAVNNIDFDHMRNVYEDRNFRDDRNRITTTAVMVASATGRISMNRHTLASRATRGRRSKSTINRQLGETETCAIPSTRADLRSPRLSNPAHSATIP
jgi:hypothetical protein